MTRRKQPKRPEVFLTTEDTGHYAGTYYRLDGVDRFYTREYIAYQHERDNMPAEEPRPFVLPRSRYNNQSIPLPSRTCGAPECGVVFVPTNARQKACTPKCAAAIRAERKRQWWAEHTETIADRRRKGAQA